MLKILQARLQQYVNWELPDVQAGFRKGRGTRDQIATPNGSSKTQESSRKTSISALLTMPYPFTGWNTTNYGKFFKRWEYQITWPASWEICMHQIGKRVHQGCILSPCLFNLCPGGQCLSCLGSPYPQHTLTTWPGQWMSGCGDWKLLEGRTWVEWFGRMALEHV